MHKSLLKLLALGGVVFMATGCELVAPAASVEPAKSSENAPSSEVSKPASATPASSSPAASTPASSQPVSSKPVTSQPVSSQPASSKPVESQPADSQPTGSSVAVSQVPSSEPQTSTPASSEPAASSAETSSVNGGTQTSGSVEISFWHTFGQTIQDNLKPQIAKFQALVKENEGVDVTVNLVPCSNYDTINDDINKGLQVNNIPTIAVAYPDHAADYLEAEGNQPGKFLVNLNDYINNETYGFGTDAYLGDAEGDSIDDFIPAYVEGGQSFAREGQFTFPYMKSTEAMLYNYDAVVKVLAHYKPEFRGAKNMIEEYMNNLDWDEFMELCRQTATYKSEINPDLQQAAFYDSDSNMFISQLYQSNIGYSSIVTNEAGKKVGHIDFAQGEDRTKAEALVTKLRSLYNETTNGVHLFTTKGAFSTYGSDSFKNVESVFTIGSTGGSGYNLTHDFQIGVCKVPPMVGTNPTYVAQGPDLCIFNNPALSENANRERVLYAWKLLKYLTNAENNCKICLLGSEGYLPVRQSAYEQDLYLEFIETIEDGEIQPVIASLVTDEIDGRYFNSPCFPGSAVLRKECGGIITEALTTNKAVSSIFDTAINNATMMIK